MEQRSAIPWCDRRRTYCASGCTVRDKFSNSGACDWESRVSLAPYVPSPGDYEPQPRSLQHQPQQQQRPQHQNGGGQQGRGGERGQQEPQFRSKYGPNQANHKKSRNGGQQRQNPNGGQNQQRNQGQNGQPQNGDAAAVAPAAAPVAEAVQQPESPAAAPVPVPAPQPKQPAAEAAPAVTDTGSDNS